MTKELQEFQSKFEDRFISFVAKQLDKDIDMIEAIKKYQQEHVAATNSLNVQKQSAAVSAMKGKKARLEEVPPVEEGRQECSPCHC